MIQESMICTNLSMTVRSRHTKRKKMTSKTEWKDLTRDFEDPTVGVL
jgi:hypothetical protein